MKFENTKVHNFEGALRGMRNPLNSWDKSDSDFQLACANYYDGDGYVADTWVKTCHPELHWPEEFSDEACLLADKYMEKLINNGVLSFDTANDVGDFAMIGPHDMKLAESLIQAGPEHRKFLRQIMVCVDITAPLYWWKEFDTYKVGTVANSTSTMHKLATTPITKDCFEMGDYEPELNPYEGNPLKPSITIDDIWDNFLVDCENLRRNYNETKDIRYWKELIRILPESWLQTRTITMNYENLISICHQRKNHKLTEWHQFIDWVRTLPYAQWFIFYDEHVPFKIT